MRKKLTPLPEPGADFPLTTELAHCYDLLSLTKLTRLGEAKCLYGEKLARLGRVTLPSQKGNPASQVTLLAEPAFCFSCKRFAKFCKKMYEKLAHPA